MAKPKTEEPTNMIGPAGSEHLRGLEGRIMRLMDEKDEISASIKEVFVEVKDAGFDGAALRKAISRKRAMDKDIVKFRQEEAALDLYFTTLYQAALPGFESLNPGLAENRKKTAAKIKAVVPGLKTEDPGGPTADETAF